MFPDENLQPADFLRQEGDIGYFQTPDGSRVSVDLRQSPYARQIAARALVERSAQGQALDAPALPPPPPTPAPGPMSLADDEPMSQQVAPPAAPPTQTPDEIRRQYALTQMRPAFQGPQPPAPVAAAPLGAPAAQPQPSAQPMRIRAPQPSLDALMVPQGYSPTLIEEIAGGTPGSRSMDRREALIGREADLLAQRANAAAAAAEAERDAIDASASRALEIEQDRRSAMSDAQQRYQRSVDALGAMREDPARLLRSAVGGVSAAIAIGLGAAGAALAGGGENTALSIVQRNID